MLSHVDAPTLTPTPARSPFALPRPVALLALGLLWLAIYGASLFSPPLLDDADATHAQAARAMVSSGDWVTLHVDGVRYLEKPPLPYWITAVSMRVFGFNSFATHLPLALTVLALAALGWAWGRRGWDERTGWYAALFTLTSAGVFLFTRVFIPDALLSLLLAFMLYAVLNALEAPSGASVAWASAAWVALGLAVLTKGFVSLVFAFAALALYLWLSGQHRLWRRLHPLGGIALLLAVAAPWHILAGLRNTGGANGHGFFWFYFINEHVLRFLGRRVPVDYNKLPGYLYWSLHLAWLFPWSLLAPVGLLAAWQRREGWLRSCRAAPAGSFGSRSVLMLGIFAALVLVFFSLSTNQEYYTFPVYLPLLLLLAAALSHTEQARASTGEASALWRTLWISQAVLTVVGLLVAGALAFGLWSARGLPAAPNVGDLLAHRGVGDYTLSMSHFFDLTGASFSALRLPAWLACSAFALGPMLALLLRREKKNLAATAVLALTSSVFLIAAHVALIRFSSMLSSDNFARRIQALEQDGQASPRSEVLLFGDQAFGSSLPFYLGQRVQLVDGRSTSMLFGSTFADVPPIFLSSQQLLREWGQGERKILFVPLEHRDEVDRLLGSRQVLLAESSGKALVTDRPLPRAVSAVQGPEARK